MSREFVRLVYLDNLKNINLGLKMEVLSVNRTTGEILVEIDESKHLQPFRRLTEAEYKEWLKRFGEPLLPTSNK